MSFHDTDQINVKLTLSNIYIYIYYFGLKKRGGKSTLELKIQPRHNDISLVEEWIKYKVHIRNRVVLSMNFPSKWI